MTDDQKLERNRQNWKIGEPLFYYYEENLWQYKADQEK